MRIAHCIQVMLFHQTDVFFHQFFTDRTSQLGVFVTVGAFHQHGHPVDTEASVLNFRSTETDVAPCQVCHLSGVIL